MCVVAAVVVASHPIVVLVDVTHVVEMVAIFVIGEQVTYVLNPVVVLVQELGEVDVVDEGNFDELCCEEPCCDGLC